MNAVEVQDEKVGELLAVVGTLLELPIKDDQKYRAVQALFGAG